MVMAAHGLLALLLLYSWTGLVLARFPYTRVWGTNLRNHLIDLAVAIGTNIASALPGLVTATVISFLTRFLAGLLDGFFDRASHSPQPPAWLEADVVGPTRRIAKGVLWLFALAMAYPYLPGAHTEAFRGLPVLIGLMLSIGSSSLLGHAGSGLILTYSRVYRRGEYVRIAEHEGTVTDLGVFATRLRTGLGEEVTLSNSLVLGAVTKNYSRAVVMSAVHANIQDVFNEHGVQIMSPHYLGDPTQPKLVPRAQGHAAPAPVTPGRPADRPT